jgi:hypothetical protein
LPRSGYPFVPLVVGRPALAVGDQRSYVHWSTFMVAEFEGKPVTTVAAKREKNRGLTEVAALS